MHIKNTPLNSGKGWIWFFNVAKHFALFWEAVVNSVVEPRATAAARTGRSDRVALGVCVLVMVKAFFFFMESNNKMGIA